MILDLYRHRGYIWRTAWSEVRTRYAGSGMGVLWNLLQPLSMILVFSLIFTSVLKHGNMGGAPYPVYLCAGLLPWTAFADCLNRGTSAFVHHAVYLRKLPIPEQVFVAQTAATSAIGLSISFAALVGVAMALGHYPSWHWALLPIPLVLLLLVGFGLGLALGTVNAFIRDVGQVVPILLQVWFWLYPIVYYESSLPKWMQAVLPYNPVYPAITGIRLLFLSREVPGPWLWVQMAIWAGGATALGYVVLRRLRAELRDVI
ncbi:MAG: ABC transporter permease [Phycisphaerales bacterium]